MRNGESLIDNCSLIKIMQAFFLSWKKWYKIIYVTMDNKPLPEYCKELFRLAGIKIDDCEHVSKKFKFKNVIVPDNSLYVTGKARYFTKEYADIITRIENNVINEKMGN